MHPPAIIIAGTHSGVGKTTISLGLMSIFKHRHRIVQPFKVGPDYIDTTHHATVSGRPSYNLDTWMMGVDGVQKTFTKIMKNADIGVIEGVMGLFDGRSGIDETGSTAHIAKTLGVPVILVLDAKGLSGSAGAIVYGFERFDTGVNIAGIIFNRVGSERHYKMLREAVETRCKAKVLGFLPREEELHIPARHLGLIMAQETERTDSKAALRKIMEKHIDIDRLLKLVSDFDIQAQANRPEDLANNLLSTKHSLPAKKVKIAVALDDAFCFYYQENLDILKELGADLLFFSPLKDSKLPDRAEGLYLGGGYPELYLEALEANTAMRESIRDSAEGGLPIFAECGGLMYLGMGMQGTNEHNHNMVGLFPWRSRLLKRRKALGYREVTACVDSPFIKKGAKVHGHEFHYSEIDDPPKEIRRVFSTINNQGEMTLEGYMYKKVLASYIHLHFASNPDFARGFITSCLTG